MTPGKVLLTSVLLLLLWAADACAIQKGLILLEDLSHSLDLTYDYGGQSTSGGGRSSSSSQHRFQEFYNFDINYAIYNPRMLKGRFTAKLRADQEYVSSSVTPSSTQGNTGFLYNIYGIFLERGYTPLKLGASSEFSHVTSSFSPGYDLTTDSIEIGTSIRNRIFPIYLDYTRFTSETSGLIQDKVQTNDQISITAVHSIQGISQTNIALYRIDSQSESKGGGGPIDSHRSFEASLKNALNTRDTKYALNTGLRLREDVTTNKTSNLDWQESFTWKLGRALNLGVGYTFDSSSQESAGVSTSRSSHSGDFWISHRLFQNLVTRFELTGRQSDLENGTESEYSGDLGFNYTKQLPRDGRLTLLYNELRTVTDRSLTTSQSTIRGETVSANLLLGNRLAQTNVIAGSVVVRDASATSLVQTYTEGPAADYVVVQVGAFFELIYPAGSRITDGRGLLVDYEFTTNPSIKYETVAHRFGTSLALAGGYTFYGSFDKSDQNLLSGNANFIQLNSSTGYKIGFTADTGYLSYGGEHSYLDSTLDKHTTFEGFVRKTFYFPKSRLLCQVRDRYTSYGKTIANPLDRTENSFNATANITRPLFRNAIGVATASFSDTRGGPVARDDAELTGNVQWGYGKLFIRMLAKLNWRVLAGITSLEQSVNLEIKRYF